MCENLEVSKYATTSLLHCQHKCKTHAKKLNELKETETPFYYFFCMFACFCFILAAAFVSSLFQTAIKKEIHNKLKTDEGILILSKH